MAGLAVVLDTNLLLSGLAYPSSVTGRLIAAGRFGELEPDTVVESDLTDRDDLPVLGTLLAALRLREQTVATIKKTTKIHGKLLYFKSVGNLV
jgi:predicted nucleic acid-binding protein